MKSCCATLLKGPGASTYVTCWGTGLGTGIGDPQHAHIKLFRAGGCHSGPLNFDQIFNNVFHVFRNNFLNFCPFGASQSPQRRILIDNQFCKFSFCKKIHFFIQFWCKVGTLGKLGKKLVFDILLIRSFKISLRSTLKAPNCKSFMGNPWGTF